jgi:hypothetical protein
LATKESLVSDPPSLLLRWITTSSSLEGALSFDSSQGSLLAEFFSIIVESLGRNDISVVEAENLIK